MARMRPWEDGRSFKAVLHCRQRRDFCPTCRYWGCLAVAHEFDGGAKRFMRQISNNENRCPFCSANLLERFRLLHCCESFGDLGTRQLDNIPVEAFNTACLPNDRLMFVDDEHQREWLTEQKERRSIVHPELVLRRVRAHPGGQIFYPYVMILSQRLPGLRTTDEAMHCNDVAPCGRRHCEWRFCLPDAHISGGEGYDVKFDGYLTQHPLACPFCHEEELWASIRVLHSCANMPPRYSKVTQYHKDISSAFVHKDQKYNPKKMRWCRQQRSISPPPLPQIQIVDADGDGLTRPHLKKPPPNAGWTIDPLVLDNVNAARQRNPKRKYCLLRQPVLATKKKKKSSSLLKSGETGRVSFF